MKITTCPQIVIFMYLYTVCMCLVIALIYTGKLDVISPNFEVFLLVHVLAKFMRIRCP